MKQKDELNEVMVHEFSIYRTAEKKNNFIFIHLLKKIKQVKKISHNSIQIKNKWFNSVNEKSKSKMARKGDGKTIKIYKLKFHQWNCVCIIIFGKNEIKIVSICIFVVVATLHRSHFFMCIMQCIHQIKYIYVCILFFFEWTKLPQAFRIDRVCDLIIVV